MMLKKLLIAVLGVVLLSGCATRLNSLQEREYAAFENANVLVEEKNPTTGMILGLLPGGGSFYVREPALGVINLLLWPASILWDPISGLNGSKSINYDLTKYSLKKEKSKEIALLDQKLSSGELDTKSYALEKSKINQKFDF